MDRVISAREVFTILLYVNYSFLTIFHSIIWVGRLVRSLLQDCDVTTRAIRDNWRSSGARLNMLHFLVHGIPHTLSISERMPPRGTQQETCYKPILLTAAHPPTFPKHTDRMGRGWWNISHNFQHLSFIFFNIDMYKNIILKDTWKIEIFIYNTFIRIVYKKKTIINNVDVL